MSEDRIAWLRSHIAVARDFARSLPEDWIQERLEMESRAEQLTDELAGEVRTRYALDRSTTLGAVHYTGTVDGLRLKSWAQHELCFEDDRPFGYGWAIYLNDCEYMASEKGELSTMAEAERAVLASIPEAVEIYRHSAERESET